MYKYKVTMKIHDDFDYTISMESEWISDEEVAFQESNETVWLLRDRYPDWVRVNCYIKLYSSDHKSVRKTWNTQEYNWGAE